MAAWEATTGMQWAAVLIVGGLGALVAKGLRVPMWAFSGTLVAVALSHQLIKLDVSAPPLWSLIAQVLVGTAVGSRVDRSTVRRFRSTLPGGLIVVSLVVPAGIALGFMIHWQAGVPALDSVLGMVPGGVPEMVAAATSLQGNSALVAAMHVVRLLVVVWLTAWLVRRVRVDPPVDGPL